MAQKIKFYIKTYGCQMNKSDSERITSVLEKASYQLVTSKNKADLLLYNMCSVRQSAIDRVWGELNNLKKQNPHKKIILTGCILESDRKKSQPMVDGIFNLSDLKNWPQKIVELFKLKEKFSVSLKELKNPASINNNNSYFKVMPNYSSGYSAFVPIMTGCNNFCSYCAVPYTRGREYSRPPEEILSEVNKLIVQGYKQIILLGQNVNSYSAHNKSGRKINFSKLLKNIEKISADFRLTFVSSHPKDVSDSLIEIFKTPKHLMPYFHFALQSGSDKILSAMNRRYTAKDYLQRVKKIRKINPKIAITTDIIVGFPGETKAEFEQTKYVFKEAGFDMAFIARYSPRSGTEAAKLKDNVSIEEKKKREKELTQILQKSALQRNQLLLGETSRILIDKTSAGYLYGMNDYLKNVKIKSNNKEKDSKDLIGQFITAKITEAKPFNLLAQIQK